jgi:hypothetical protein
MFVNPYFHLAVNVSVSNIYHLAVLGLGLRRFIIFIGCKKVKIRLFRIYLYLLWKAPMENPKLFSQYLKPIFLWFKTFFVSGQQVWEQN